MNVDESIFKFKPILDEIRTAIGDACILEQNYFELAEFISICREQKVTTVLEVGSRFGGTLRSWMKLLPTTHLVTVDKPWEEVTGTQELPELRKEREARWRTWLAPDQKLHCVWGSSHALESLASVKNKIVEWGLNGFDMVFIDGDHTFEAAMRDIKAWAPKVKVGGLLCGHDREQEGVPEALLQFLGAPPPKAAGTIWFAVREGK